MNTDTMLENVTLPIDVPLNVTLNEKHQQVLIALHHLGEMQVNELKVVAYLLSSSRHDYVELLKKIISDVVWAYGVVDPIEVAINNDYVFKVKEFQKLSDFKKLYDVRKLSATNFNRLPEIDEEIQYLINRDLIIKSKSNTIIEYDCKTKKNIKYHQKDGWIRNFSAGDSDSIEFDSVKTKEFPNELINLTDEGKRVAQSIAEGRRVIFRPLRSKRTAIFIACAFGYEEINQLYDIHLKPACEEFCYLPLRVDLHEPAQSITKSILDGITEAECVIADLTFARPSVYFEVGLAHGLGIPLVLTCRKDHLNGTEDDKKVHFDLAQYKISYWSVTEQGEFEWEEGMSPAERLKLVLIGAKR